MSSTLLGLGVFFGFNVGVLVGFFVLGTEVGLGVGQNGLSVGHSDLTGVFDGLGVGGSKTTIGTVVGVYVGDTVGFAEGIGVGISVGDTVGWYVGFAVGITVGSYVGDGVGFVVGISVGDTDRKSVV